ncbi:MAG: DUF4038 domain-containing protein [Armatimonadia bacterium]
MLEAPSATVFESTLSAAADYDNPLRDVTTVVTFTGPDGSGHAVEAFWDGDQTFRVRFCPEVAGPWSWESTCSNTADTGLHAQRGEFRCLPYDGDNPLYRHGSVGLSADRHHFAHRDGTPFFWLADTAWNGALKSDPQEWESYLKHRAKQRFTAVQVVTTQWRANQTDRVFTLDGELRVLPEAFQRLDARLGATNDHGLIAAPVMLWALTKDDPGVYLSEEDAIALGRYQQARWGAYQVMWILGGDGRYLEGDVTRWHRIGRGIFSPPFGARASLPARLVTMHPCGTSWVVKEFRHEPWFGFHGYQSGHGDSDDHLRWLINGPPDQPWQAEPVHPIVNLEPNYETHISYHSKRRITPQQVRRAAYWSLLVTPPAGITYGNNSVWWWGRQPEVPLAHDAIGVVDPWQAGLDLPGVGNMTVLRDFFESLPWPQLRPAQQLLATQPGDEDPNRHVMAAATTDGTVAVIYTPVGGELSLVLKGLTLPLQAQWFSPRNGDYTAAGQVTSPNARMTTPDHEDWVLLLNT